MMASGRQLHAERDRQGLTLEDVARQIQVSERYLDAIERDDVQALPEEPYRSGYLRLYTTFLGIDDVGEPPPRDPVVNDKADRLWLVAGALAVALLLVGVVAANRATGEAPGGLLLDQHVQVQMLRTGHLTVVVDGVVEHDRVYQGGESIEVRGQDRIDVSVQSVDRVRITYNGQRVLPQGVQDQPRLLAFVDDESEG